jgi:hypothetical protein
MTPAVVQALALAWLAVVTIIVTAAIPVGLVVIKGFNVWRQAFEPKVSVLETASTKHATEINGLLAPRIAAVAAAVVAVHEAGMSGAVPAAVVVPVAGAAERIAVLQAEIASLQVA